MKKVLCVILCVLLLSFASGCNKTKGTYTILPMEEADGTVDKEIIDRFLTDNSSNYKEIQKNVPDVLSQLMDITPEALQDKCSIYKFRKEFGTGLAGRTYLVCDNKVFPIGNALGGYGITEFAYINDSNQDMLYFIYSWGSGIHRSHIGAFNFNTKEITDYGGLIKGFQGNDIAFCLSKDNKTLGICEAEIKWTNYDTGEVEITKGKRIFRDIDAFAFTAIDKEE